VVPISCEIPCSAALIALGLWTGRHHDQEQAGGEAQAQREKQSDKDTR
jgi:hypothetical protein